MPGWGLVRDVRVRDLSSAADLSRRKKLTIIGPRPARMKVSKSLYQQTASMLPGLRSICCRQQYRLLQASATKLAKGYLGGPFALGIAERATIGHTDVPEMLELTAATEPGPFLAQTIKMGSYFGIRASDGRLVAMAGERLQCTEFVEISAVLSMCNAFTRIRFPVASGRVSTD